MSDIVDMDPRRKRHPVFASAGGSATVGDDDVTVTYQLKGATVRLRTPPPDQSHQIHHQGFRPPPPLTTAMVYIPITNPDSQIDKLTKISVECKGTKAKATELWVYFGAKEIYKGSVPNGDKDFDLEVAGSSSQPDCKPYGINVSIKLVFENPPVFPPLPADGGAIQVPTEPKFEIYSVTLEFDPEFDPRHHHFPPGDGIIPT